MNRQGLVTMERIGTAFKEHANEIALQIGDARFSYDDVHAFAQRLRAPVERCADQPVVAILAEASLTAYATIAAAALYGWVYVPLDPDAPERRLARVLRLSGATTLVTDPQRAGLAGKLLETARQHGRLARLLCPEAATGERSNARLRQLSVNAAVPADEPLYLMFTSGTTGEPKGIEIHRPNLSAYLDSALSLMTLEPGDRCSAFFKPTFDLSVHDVFVTWCQGATLCVPSRAQRLDPVRYAQAQRLTSWFSVPSLAALAMQTRRLQPACLPALTRVLFCGEALGGSVAKAMQRAAPQARVHNLYGPTEATIAITHHELTSRSSTSGGCVPIGEPFKGQETVVVDEDGDPVAPATAGELYLGGSQLADGYYRNREQTQRAFVDRNYPGKRSPRWYRTGDLVRRHPDHGLVFLGRRDDQIKLHGHRIEVGEIEDVLRRASNSSLVLVSGAPAGAAAVQGLVGFVCRPHAPVEQIRERLREWLPRYMVPGRIVSIDEPDFNSNLKLDRKQIAARFVASHA